MSLVLYLIFFIALLVVAFWLVSDVFESNSKFF